MRDIVFRRPLRSVLWKSGATLLFALMFLACLQGWNDYVAGKVFTVVCAGLAIAGLFMIGETLLRRPIVVITQDSIKTLHSKPIPIRSVKRLELVENIGAHVTSWEITIKTPSGNTCIDVTDLDSRPEDVAKTLLKEIRKRNSRITILGSSPAAMRLIDDIR